MIDKKDTYNYYLTMSNQKLEDCSVVQSNDLVTQTNWVMNKVPLKIFKAVVAAIDTLNPPEDNIIIISKKELIKVVDGDSQNYDYLKKEIRKLSTSVKVYSDDQKEKYVALMTDLIWEKESDVIKVKFHNDVMKYLLTKKDFLKYSASFLPMFKSKYGLILYENILSDHKKYHSGQYTLTIDKLRWVTGTIKLHKDFRNFEKHVIRPAVNDINQANVEILLKYEKIKSGRNVKAIKFYVADRQSYQNKTYEDAVLGMLKKEKLTDDNKLNESISEIGRTKYENDKFSDDEFPFI